MFRFPSARKTSSRRTGATAVEFALAAPLAFMLLCGSIEFGRANMVLNATANAAYQGARRAIVPGATSAQAISAANATLTASSVKSATVTVSPSTISTTTQTVSVTVSVPLNANSWMSAFFTKNISISRSCTLTRERAK
jgi:Flp pilus assembly protein TadG